MALNIRVNDDFKITSDNYNVIVSKKRIIDPTKSASLKRLEIAGVDLSARETWKDVAFFSKMDSALVWILNQSIRESESTSLQEVVDLVNKVSSEINYSKSRLTEGFHD